MVDFVDQTLMTAAPEYWEGQIEKIHDERLEKVLGVEYFGMPGNKNGRKGISYVRFPQWYFCPMCRKFQPLDEWVKDYKKSTTIKKEKKEKDPYMVNYMRCPTCNQELVVTRFITACEKNGHIDDFPWIKWVHCRNFTGPQNVCKNPVLKFKTANNSSEGLDGIRIECGCGAKASLSGAFEKGLFKELDENFGNKYDFSCTGNHPWKHLKEECEEYPEVLQRGGASVYFPHIDNSLVIPPYSNLLTMKIEKSEAFESCRNFIETLEGLSESQEIEHLKDSQIKKSAKKIALEISADETKVLEVLKRKWFFDEEDVNGTSTVKYRADEYAALSGEIKVPSDEYGDFVRESTDINDYKIPFVKNVSLIHKVREVQVLTGFSRIKPVESEIGTEKNVSNLVSVKEKDTKWYPAYQVRGEGIFLEFDNDAIESWLSRNPKIKKRIDLLNENYSNSYFGANNPRTFSPKFLLLHTISHLLIKQLSFECGYSIASLKERLYCSEEDEVKQMAGILVYTASGDSEGTLGGLVRQGRSDTLPRVFRKAIESAIACSNDPVCSLSQGQGRDSLNLAACHSCLLIPETSCEEYNIILDRGVVVGTLEDPSLGLYSNYVYNEGGWDLSEAVTYKSSRMQDEKPEYTIELCNGGYDQHSESVKDIWEYLLEDCEDEEEMNIINNIADSCSDNMAKPIYRKSFIIPELNKTFFTNLIWHERKVILFLKESYEDYKVALKTGWHCYCTAEDIDVDEFIDRIGAK